MGYSVSAGSGSASAALTPAASWGGGAASLWFNSVGKSLYGFMALRRCGFLTGSCTATQCKTYIPLNTTIDQTSDFRSPSLINFMAATVTGNKTINEKAGSVRIAAAGTSVVLTNSYVVANSLIYCVVATNDTTAKSVAYVAATGSVTFYLNAAATAEVEIRWSILNV